MVDDHGIAHFLVDDGAVARQAFVAAGMHVLVEREVLVRRLTQDEPGQLGKLTRRMGEAGVNIEVLYSDHRHQLILIVEDIVAGRAVSETWTRERERAEHR